MALFFILNSFLSIKLSQCLNNAKSLQRVGGGGEGEEEKHEVEEKGRECTRK
jgi:hypothetical protein